MTAFSLKTCGATRLDIDNYAKWRYEAHCHKMQNWLINQYRLGDKFPVYTDTVFGYSVRYDIESVFDNWEIWLKGLVK